MKFFFTFSLLFFYSSFFGQELPYVITNNAKIENIYKLPTEKSKIITSAIQDSRFVAIESREGWYKIDLILNGIDSPKTGWVKAGSNSFLPDFSTDFLQLCGNNVIVRSKADEKILPFSVIWIESDNDKNYAATAFGQYFAIKEKITQEKTKWYKIYLQNNCLKFKDDKLLKASYGLISSNYVNYIDSYNKVKRNKTVLELQTKYQTERKEKENLKLKAEQAEQAMNLQKENNQKRLLGLGFLASLLTLFFFSYSYKKNKYQKELIENLQKELHHRIKNNLAIINSFINVTRDEYSNPIFDEKLIELQNRIESINEVHKQLYNNKDVVNLNIKKYIIVLVKNVQYSFANTNVEIQLNISEDLQVHADKSFPVGLIINEFLTNSFKYAFDESMQPKITIVMKDMGKNYQLSLNDNGKGIPENFNIKTTNSFGLRIMNLLAKQLKGTFEIINNNGTEVRIAFPK